MGCQAQDKGDLKGKIHKLFTPDPLFLSTRM